MPRRAHGAGVSSFTIAFLLALALGTRGDDWTQGGLTSARTSASAELSGSPFDAASWSLPPYYPSRITSSPAVADGVVVVGTSDGRIQAARAVDGTSLWSFSARDGVLASPALLKGRVYAPSIDGNLYCLRLSDGAPVWQSALGGAGYSSPTIVSDTRLLVAVGFPQKKVMLVDTATGNAVWQTAPGAITAIVNSSAAVSGNRAIIGSMGGRFYALDLSTGAVQWTFDAPGLVNLSSPLVAGGTAYLLPGGDGAKLYAVDAATGAAKAGWPLDLADPVAPPAGTILRTNLAVSSPSLAGSWLVFQVRFDYYMPGAGPGLYTYTLREYAVGVNPATPAVGWMAAVGSKDLTNPNEIPELNSCATPAAFPAASGALVAVSSSLESTLRVLDPSSGGAVLWSGSLSGPGRSSPVLANGRLFVGTDPGVLESYLSSVNRPPTAPVSGFSPANGEVVTTLRPTLDWAAASDPEGKPLTYAVRLGTGGEVLQNWIAEFTTGATQVALGADLQQGVLYTYAVRSRDPNGAWSDWSAPQTFAVNLTAAPTITVDGTAVGTIGEAVAAVVPGGTIRLGKGTLRLVVPLQIPAGVSLLGVSAWETLIDARGLGSGVVLLAGAGPGATRVDGLAIFGAAKDLEVQGQGAVISHVVLQGAAQAGLEVSASGSAVLFNATVAMNSVGARSLGALEVRDSIVVQNSIGLSASGGGSLTTSYNDLFGNAVAYDGASAGAGDLAQPVVFSNPAAMDYRLLKAQATTDAGDPSGDASLEPAPNGGRVNLGAFGGTALAEPSLVPIAASVASGRSCGAASASSPSGRGMPWMLLTGAAMGLWALLGTRGPRRSRLATRLPTALLLLLVVMPIEGRAPRRAPKVWNHASLSTAANWDDPTKWSPAGVPAAGDDVTFSGTGPGDCNINVNINPATITITNDYPGLIARDPLVNPVPTIVISGAFTQAGGTFNANGSATTSIGGNFSLTGGTFVMEGDLTFNGALWDVSGGAINSGDGAGTLTFSRVGTPTTWQPFADLVKKDQIWVEDAVPAGAALGYDGGDSWNWVTSSPAPFSGTRASQSDNQTKAMHQHYFYNAAVTLPVVAGDTLFAWVFLDLANPPSEVMLQWNNGNWEHRAYWSNSAPDTSIGWGSEGQVSRRRMGGIGPGVGLPEPGFWKLLTVPVDSVTGVGLEGSTLNGMAFTLFGGRATWDKCGKNPGGSETVWLDDRPFTATYASSGGDAWTWVGSPVTSLLEAHQSNNQTPPTTQEHQHYFYGATNQLTIRTGDKLFAYVHLDAVNPPSEVMLQWNNGSWEHRAYWGANLIGWGTNLSPSRFQVSPTFPAPDVNGWRKLEVNASDVGLEGSTLNGMAFTLAGGKATWDYAGRNGYGGAATYGNVTVASGTTVNLPLGENAAMSGSMTVNGTFTSSGSNISVKKTLTVASSGTFTPNATPVQVGNGALTDGVRLTSGTLNAPSGLMTVNGPFIASGGTTFANNGGKVMMVTNGSFSLTPPTQAFNHLIVNDTLEGYWKLDAAAGNTLADFSGYGRDGTSMSGTTPTAPTIGAGAGVNFTNPGSLTLAGSRWVTVASPPPLASKAAITLAGWINPTAVSGNQKILSLGSPAPVNGVLGEYYANSATGAAPPPPKASPEGGATTANPKLVRFDRNISFGFSSPPAPGIPNDDFMVAWTGNIVITNPGRYDFRVNTDDGSRMWLDTGGGLTKIINSWVDQGPTNRDSTVLFPAGFTLAAGSYPFRVEFYENGGGQQCIVSYMGPDTVVPPGGTGSPLWSIIPNSALTPGASGNARAQIGINGTSIVVNGSSNGIETRTQSGGTIAATTWTHIAGVIDYANNQIIVYRNGAEVARNAAAAFALPATSADACALGALGSEQDGLANFFAGSLDDMRVYSRALTPQEIAALALGNQPMTSVASAASSVFLLGGSILNVDGDLTLNFASLYAVGNTINVKGNWFNHGGAFQGNTGTVNLTGNNPGQRILSGGQHFHGLTVNSGSGAGGWTLSDRLYVDTLLDLQSGTLDASTYSNPHAGSVTMSFGSTFTVPTTLVLMTNIDASNTITTPLTNLRIENPIEADLRGYWKFDEGQGPTAGDSAYAPTDPSRRNATLRGGVAWTADQPSLLFDKRYALTFDGLAGSYADAGGYNPALPPIMPGSQSNQGISLWFKYTSVPSGTQNFFTLKSTSANKETNIGLFLSGTERVGVRTTDLSGPTTTLVDVAAPSSGAWHHLVYTFDTTTNRLYIDGSLVATSAVAPLAFQPSNVYFGASSTLSDRFTGYLDDVRVYTRALTQVEVTSLRDGKYANAGVTLSMWGSWLDGSTPLNVSGTFDLDYGIFNGLGASTNVTGAANVNGGTYQVDTGTSTFSSGLIVGSSGVLETTSSLGLVQIADTRTLDIRGKLRAATPASAGTTIDRVGGMGGSGSYTFTVAGTAVLDIDGLQVQHTGTNGMDIADGATFTKFKRLSFTNNPAAARHLRIARNTATTIVAPGCFFDVTATKNVTFLGGSGGTANPTLYLEARDAATNGAGASTVAIAEGRTEDGDTVRNGIPDVPVTNDGVVFWTRGAANDMTGSIQGFPTPAFNWTGFIWYATYVVYSGSGTANDTIYVRDANGGPLYSFSVNFSTYGRVVGTPRWDQEGVTKVLYVATSGGTTPGGRILKFTDNGVFLSMVGSFDVPASVSAITSPTIMDGTNIYFGGLDSGAVPKVFAVKRMAPMALTLVKTIDTFGFTVRTAPSWRSIGTTYLFVGSDVVAPVPAQAHLYRIDVSSGPTGVDSDNTGPKHSVNAATTVSTAAVFAGDDGGRMHGTEVALLMANLAGWPYRDTVRHSVANLDAGLFPIRAMAYVDPATGRVYYGDWDLHFYVLDSAGALVSGFPVTLTPLDSSEHFQSAALPLSGKVAVGTTKGRLFVIDVSTGAVSFTYNFGPTASISGIAYSSAQNVYLVGTSTGQLFTITPR